MFQIGERRMQMADFSKPDLLGLLAPLSGGASSS
jgi:hypothetical protein